uniref:Uncharacterized protein n=1 Tax=Thermogemmatispora argillosa TaxID=2045280 RepID=A0A455T752_9CHLR|nr:hypothetical protein KTA_33540 [Thermogemmatispora argillosa]
MRPQASWRGQRAAQWQRVASLLPPAAPARPSVGEWLRQVGIWLVALTLPELVGGVLLVRALPWAARVRADLGIALLAAAALQVVLGLALWRRAAHWWVLLAFLLAGIIGALLR